MIPKQGEEVQESLTLEHPNVLKSSINDLDIIVNFKTPRKKSVI